MLTISNLKHAITKNKSYLIILLIFLLPRLINLGSDISNYDASFWYPRMDSFTLNLIEGDLEETYQKYHPGLTLMLFAGTSKYIFQVLFEQVFGYNPRFFAQQFIKLQIATLTPLILITSGFGLFWYKLLSEIVNRKFAFIFCVLISLEPFFLGVSKFVHVTALAAIFVFTAFLSLYYYLNIKNEKLYFYISAICLGLGILTKIDSSILGSLLIAYLALKQGVFKQETILNVIKYSLIVFATFYLLFPSLWVAPFYILKRMFIEGLRDTAFTSSGEPTILHVRYFYYLEVFFYRTLPTTVLAFIASFFFIIKKAIKKEWGFFVIAFTFLVIQIIVYSVPAKIKDRYIISLLPFYILFSAYTYYQLLFMLPKAAKYALLALIISYYIFVTYRYHPVYSFYYSDFIGGANGMNKLNLLLKNRGEYYAQTAGYLNSLDGKDSVNKTVLIDHKEQVRTFAFFYYGKTFTSPGLIDDGDQIDYIITRDDMEYLVPRDKCEYLKSFGPKDPFGYKVVNAYRCMGIDNSYKDFRN